MGATRSCSSSSLSFSEMAAAAAAAATQGGYQARKLWFAAEGDDQQQKHCRRRRRDAPKRFNPQEITAMEQKMRARRKRLKRKSELLDDACTPLRDAAASPPNDHGHAANGDGYAAAWPPDGASAPPKAVDAEESTITPPKAAGDVSASPPKVTADDWLADTDEDAVVVLDGRPAAGAVKSSTKSPLPRGVEASAAAIPAIPKCEEWSYNYNGNPFHVHEFFSNVYLAQWEQKEFELPVFVRIGVDYATDNYHTMDASPASASDQNNRRIQGSFEELLQKELERPYDEVELVEKMTKALYSSSSCDDRQEKDSPSSSVSYLEQYRDFHKVLARSGTQQERLKLLRGLFFWIEHKSMEDSFPPWARKPRAASARKPVEASKDVIVLD